MIKNFSRLRVQVHLYFSCKSIGTVKVTVSSELLEKKENLIKNLNIDRKAKDDVLKWDTQLVEKCSKVCNRDVLLHREHRIKYMASSLDSDEATIIKLICKCKFILNKPLDQIKRIITLLKENKVKSKDILKDPWILQYKEDLIALRLSKLKNAEIDYIKPWMTRCDENIFNAFMNRHSRRQELLGENSVVEYISQRLGCTTLDVQRIISRGPQLQRTSVLKMKRILDFLFSSGFTANHILQGLPRIANRRIETINARLMEMTEAGIPKNLMVIARSQREYKEYLRKWKKRNTNINRLSSDK